MLLREYELAATHDARQSFYGKAVVKEYNGQNNLYSYGTRVASVFSNGEAEVYNLQSATTLRHVKEFLKQHGFKADSKAQIEKDYYNPESWRVSAE